MVSEGIYRSEITIDLSRYINNDDLNDRVIKISLLANLNTSLNRCEEANSDVFFFRIKNNSALRSQNKPYFNYNISNFINFKFDKLNIHLPEELSPKIAEAYIKLRLFLERNFPNIEKELIFGSDYKSDVIMSRNLKTGNIFIKDGNKIDLDRNFKLSIGSGAADSFISKVRTLYLNDKMEVIKFNEDEKKQRQLSLSKLGFNSLVFNGIGEIEKNVLFTSADLGFNPEKLEFYINSDYTAPINNQAADKDNSYLKIYFNGQLVRAHQLDYSGTIDNLYLDLPLYLLEQENRIQFVYSYYPLGRDCVADGQDFEAVISPDSYLNIKGEKVDEVITFNNLLNNFYGNGRVMLDIDNKELSLKHAARVISSFRKLDSRYLNINVDFVNSDQEFEISESFRWGIAVLANYKDYKIDSFLKIDNGEINLHQNSKNFIFEGKSPNASAAWQLDKIDGKPFSLITTSNLSKESLNSLDLLSRRINDIDFYRNLDGTLLFSSGGKLTDFAADEYAIVKADQRNQLVNIYKKYKVQLFIVFVILIIILSYLVYIKLAQKPEEK
ncbi:MAG: cellulose biosynthesis cyclic di-GMP-binding regulatory protein BcsB [Halanaerobiales bacterium]|nr:cellulose biosynthesis cyclic di-GMP-binding regulatory protein BcsB [Halanaerobiales bacterium]